jgi:hypothetical protein
VPGSAARAVIHGGREIEEPARLNSSVSPCARSSGTRLRLGMRDFCFPSLPLPSSAVFFPGPTAQAMYETIRLHERTVHITASGTCELLYRVMHCHVLVQFNSDDAHNSLTRIGIWNSHHIQAEPTKSCPISLGKRTWSGGDRSQVHGTSAHLAKAGIARYWLQDTATYRDTRT